MVHIDKTAPNIPFLEKFDFQKNFPEILKGVKVDFVAFGSISLVQHYYKGKINLIKPQKTKKLLDIQGKSGQGHLGGKYPRTFREGEVIQLLELLIIFENLSWTLSLEQKFGYFCKIQLFSIYHLNTYPIFFLNKEYYNFFQSVYTFLLFHFYCK